jgi:hypothetical protein
MNEVNSPTHTPEPLSGHPELVLRELPDGRVTGVVMREMRSSFHVNFAGEFVEPDEVERGIEVLRRLGRNDTYGTWKKESDIDAASLDEALVSSPESAAGQTFVFLYRGNEWIWGIWNNPDHPKRSSALNHLTGLQLHSVADFHGIRVSTAKRAERPVLDTVRAHKTVAGPYQVLTVAIELLERSQLRARDKQDYEAHPAVCHLCDWWNRVAPEGSREAGFARLYVWSEATRIFNACDPEEPAVRADQVDTWTSYALFEHPGLPPVLASFFRGRRFNKEDDHGFTTIFAADGSEGSSIGLDVSEVDEAYYSLLGLESLAMHRTWSSRKGFGG